VITFITLVFVNILLQVVLTSTPDWKMAVTITAYQGVAIWAYYMYLEGRKRNGTS